MKYNYYDDYYYDYYSLLWCGNKVNTVITLTCLLIISGFQLSFSFNVKYTSLGNKIIHYYHRIDKTDVTYHDHEDLSKGYFGLRQQHLKVAKIKII
jgi:hypothetical protein